MSLRGGRDQSSQPAHLIGRRSKRHHVRGPLECAASDGDLRPGCTGLRPLAVRQPLIDGIDQRRDFAQIIDGVVRACISQMPMTGCKARRIDDFLIMEYALAMVLQELKARDWLRQDQLGRASECTRRLVSTEPVDVPQERNPLMLARVRLAKER